VNGQVFTGGEGRIVGPAAAALGLHAAINDLDLRVAFVDGPAESAAVYTRAMMAQIGVDFPVLALPTSARATWEADTERPEHLRRIYEGELPTEGRRSSFELVRPGKDG
jgi:hypothetical protein